MVYFPKVQLDIYKGAQKDFYRSWGCGAEKGIGPCGAGVQVVVRHLPDLGIWTRIPSPLETKRQALLTIEASLQAPGCSHSGQKKWGWGQEVKGVPPSPLEGPQPAPLVQQAQTCPSLGWEPTPPALP